MYRGRKILTAILIGAAALASSCQKAPEAKQTPKPEPARKQTWSIGDYVGEAIGVQKLQLDNFEVSTKGVTYKKPLEACGAQLALTYHFQEKNISGELRNKSESECLPVYFEMVNGELKPDFKKTLDGAMDMPWEKAVACSDIGLAVYDSPDECFAQVDKTYQELKQVVQKAQAMQESGIGSILLGL
ncbi:hypothetical protein HN587_02475 [Candidatus Woesearchaeota archaeon]|jgi:hypothetical protein|nr:hypothetical protein [Candidatus Woesearchaeota archaeon]